MKFATTIVLYSFCFKLCKCFPRAQEEVVQPTLLNNGRFILPPVLPPPIPESGQERMVPQGPILYFPTPPPEETSGFLQRPIRPGFGPNENTGNAENGGQNKPPFYPFPWPPPPNGEEKVPETTAAPTEARPTFTPIPLPDNKPIYMPIYDPLAPKVPPVETTTEYVPTPDYDRVFNILNYESPEEKRIRYQAASKHV